MQRIVTEEEWIKQKEDGIIDRDILRSNLIMGMLQVIKQQQAGPSIKDRNGVQEFAHTVEGAINSAIEAAETKVKT